METDLELLERLNIDLKDAHLIMMRDDLSHREHDNANKILNFCARLADFYKDKFGLRDLSQKSETKSVAEILKEIEDKRND